MHIHCLKFKKEHWILLATEFAMAAVHLQQWSYHPFHSTPIPAPLIDKLFFLYVEQFINISPPCEHLPHAPSFQNHQYPSDFGIDPSHPFPCLKVWFLHVSVESNKF